jgi:hypothetical protein
MLAKCCDAFCSERERRPWRLTSGQSSARLIVRYSPRGIGPRAFSLLFNTIHPESREPPGQPRGRRRIQAAFDLNGGYFET